MRRYAYPLLSLLAGSFFSSPVISSLRAVNFCFGHSNRRIKNVNVGPRITPTQFSSTAVPVRKLEPKRRAPGAVNADPWELTT